MSCQYFLIIKRAWGGGSWDIRGLAERFRALWCVVTTFWRLTIGLPLISRWAGRAAVHVAVWEVAIAVARRGTGDDRGAILYVNQKTKNKNNIYNRPTHAKYSCITACINQNRHRQIHITRPSCSMYKQFFFYLFQQNNLINVCYRCKWSSCNSWCCLSCYY